MNKEAPYSVKIITVVLLVIFAVLLGLSFRQFQRSRRMHEIDSYKTLIDNVRHKTPLASDDVPIIQSWMTFAYVNTIFNIPPIYLEQTLAITDPKYPKISIGRYAKNKQFSETGFVGTVQHAVLEYVTSTSTNNQ